MIQWHHTMVEQATYLDYFARIPPHTANIAMQSGILTSPIYNLHELLTLLSTPVLQTVWIKDSTA